MRNDATIIADEHSLFGALRARLAVRPDSEHVQALVRLAIGIIGTAYVAFAYSGGKLTAGQHHILFIALGFVVAAIVIFVSIVVWPAASPKRRFSGMVLDFSATSYFMYIMEDMGILFFAVYLWVTIGNGLRYGSRYLFIAMSAGIFSFAVVFANSSYWQQQWGFSLGLIIGLIALPLYLSSLLRQLEKQHHELKQLYHQMARHATHDFLTNLPNRKYFYEQLEIALASARQDGGSFTILYLDLDGFKSINDDLGHVVGDQLIERTARRIERCVRKADMVARVGGDEFVVILRAIAPADAGKVAEKIISALAEPVNIDGKTLTITISIGIATYPQDGMNVNALIHSADTAMYEAKRSGKNGYRVYHSENPPFMATIANNRNN